MIFATVQHRGENHLTPYVAFPSSNRFGRDILLDGDRALVMHGSTTSSHALQEFAYVVNGWSNTFVQSGLDPQLVAGAQVNAQWIFRDPNGPSALAPTAAVEFNIRL